MVVGRETALFIEDSLSKPDGEILTDGDEYIRRLFERSNLTRLQLAYWIGQSLRRGSPAFNTIYTYSISGMVDRKRFHEAFQTLLDYSDALRTVIEEVDGIPRQKVIPKYSYELEYLDFSEWPDPQGSLERWLHERSQIPLNLGECLFDSALAKVSEDQYIWYLNMHHLITDATTFIVIFQRLAKLYVRSDKREDLDITGWPTFNKYIEYELSYRRSAQYQKARAYWARKLSPGPEVIHFFGKTLNKHTTRARRVSFDLGTERSKVLKAKAREKGVFTVSEEFSLYNIFAALFFAFLHQASGNHRLGVTTPVHNRFTDAFRETVGLLIEMCPLQVEISGNETYESLIGRVKRETRETMSYYQYGSGVILQNQVFDVMFNMYALPSLILEGAKVRAERIHPGHGNESLAIHVIDEAESNSFVLHFDFHEDIFNKELQQQTLEAFVRMVDAYLDDSRQRIIDERFAPEQVEEVNREERETEQKYLEFDKPGQVPPKDLLEFQLLQVWQEVLGVKSIGVNDNFFELGGNSWLAVRMFVEIEKVTGKYLPLTTLLQAATIASLAKVIREEIGAEIGISLIKIRPGKEKRPIFFAPGAAENGLAVARIARYLDEDQPVYMVQVPVGMGDEKVQLVRIEDMATDYLQALQSVQPEGPYMLGGYSAGGLVALEVAQQLQRQGQKVALLAIVDVPAQSPNYRILQAFIHGLSGIFRLHPGQERSLFLTLRDVLFRLDYFIKRGLREWFGKQIVRFRRFIRAGSRGRIFILQKQLARAKSGFKGTESKPANQHSKGSVEEGDLLWQNYDRHMREHFDVVNEAVKCYVPQVYPGKVILFRSSIGYRRPEMRMADPKIGWGRIAAGGLEMYSVPGNHMDIVREPSVKVVGEQLHVLLEETQEQIQKDWKS